MLETRQNQTKLTQSAKDYLRVGKYDSTAYDPHLFRCLISGSNSGESEG